MSIAFKKMTRSIAWVMTASLAVAFMLPSSAAAVEFFNAPFRYQWKAQSGTDSGTAHEVRANAGDTVAMSLTITNRSTDPKALTIYGTSALTPEVAPYRGAHELRLGTSNPHDKMYDWVDPSSFISNPDGASNRLAAYDGAAVTPGQDLTFNFNLKIKAGTANGTYDFYTGIVREYDAWARQVTSTGRLLPSEDIFWRVIVGGGSVTPATGGLSVALASGTPVAGNIAAGSTSAGNANFTKVTLTAAAGATVKITSVYITRDGLSADSDLENIKLLKADGTQVGNTAGGFNANHKAQVYITPGYELTGSQDFYLRAGFITGATASRTARLGISNNADIVSNATAVTGAPVYGNYMTSININIGTVTIAEDGTVTDTTPDVGDTNVITNTFKLTAGSEEAVTIDRITVLKAGSSETSDTTNIELWDVTNNKTLGTAETWTSDGKASWPVDIKLGKGDSIRLRIQLDIVDGVTLTVNTDIIDGTDTLVFVKGDSYGFYITPTISGSWAGQPTANQTINTGAVNISKSSTSPATSNVAIADNQLLTVWDFDVKGESVRISLVNVDIEAAASWGDGETYADLTNGRLVDMATGNILSGPVDGTADSDTASSSVDAADDGAFAFTNTFVLPVGITKIGFKVRIGSDFDGAETLSATIGIAADVTSKGLITNSAIAETGLESSGNTQTIKAGALVMRTLTIPATSNVVVGISDYVWSTFALDASASGEDVLVSALTVTDTMDGNTANMGDIDQVELWADLDNNGSFETRISGSETPTGTDGDDTDTQAFTLTQTVRVVKGGEVRVQFIGDLGSAAYTDVGETHALTLTSGDVTGADTGQTITETTSGTAGTLTIAEGGSITVSIGTSNPDAGLIMAGSTKTTLGAWKLYAADEAYKVTKMTFGFTNSAGTQSTTINDSVNKLYVVYKDKDGVTKEVGSAVSDYYVTFDNLDMWVNKSSSAEVVLKADLNKITASDPADFREDIYVTFEADDEDIDADTAGSEDLFTAIGQSSGVEDDDAGTDTVGNEQVLYKTILTVAQDTAGLGTVLTAGTLDLYRFKVTADSLSNGSTGEGVALKKFLFSVTITDADAGETLALDTFSLLRNGTTVTNVDIGEVALVGTYTGNVEADDTSGDAIVGETLSYVQVAFITEATTETGESTIGAGATVTYLLKAATHTDSSAYESNDTVAVKLEGDTTLPTATATYLSDDDATNDEYIIALQTSAGVQDTADVEFIWSDLSGANHSSGFDDDGVAETSTTDWTNGYLVKNFPLGTFVITAA
ncbi:hypothetical protein A2994_00220 [candidate division Kazan bacterium RIFCSPLOWO2_01_FULL_48_13]|uniref:Uncharacterized protein n=1 Tax=candidate division Kazan bacterium RIFCSPLOWO2_01_FULL_48_13 TaxID=1798539 RepID=A0A1F4PN18_UNCK3|nr:MAG: hypothetical protein A2994_00220 [candidate division Kazan bacterium RIFCSPLOWO2_01_FULL_48_13]